MCFEFDLLFCCVFEIVNKCIRIILVHIRLLDALLSLFVWQIERVSFYALNVN